MRTLVMAAVICTQVHGYICPTIGGQECNGGSCSNGVCDCWSFRSNFFSADYFGPACESFNHSPDLDQTFATFDQHVCSGNGECIGTNVNVILVIPVTNVNK